MALPPDMPQLVPTIFYQDPRVALEWLEKAFGFRTRTAVTDGSGSIVHAESELGSGVIMVGPARPGTMQSPRTTGGVCTQSVCVYVEDVDTLYKRARSAGAKISMELSDKEYGDRGFGALDLEGHMWWFSQRMDQEKWEAANADYRV